MSPERGSADLTEATVTFTAVDETTASYLEGLKEPIPVDFEVDTKPDGTVIASMEIEAASVEPHAAREVHDAEVVMEDEEGTTRTFEADEIEMVVDEDWSDEDTVMASIETEDHTIGGTEFSGSMELDLTATDLSKEELIEVLTDKVSVSVDMPGATTRPSEHSPLPIEEKDFTVSGEKLSHEMEAAPGPGSVTMEEDPHDEMTYTTHEFEVDPDVAEATYESVVDAIEERRNDHFTIDHIVLGIPQYKALTAYINQDRPYASDETVESFLGLEVTVVPGPMIHPVIENKRLLTEHL